MTNKSSATVDACSRVMFDFGVYLAQYFVCDKKIEKDEDAIPEEYLTFLKDYVGISWDLLAPAPLHPV